MNNMQSLILLQNQLNLQPLVGEIGRAKNLRFISPQPPEAYRAQLPSPEAIAEGYSQSDRLLRLNKIAIHQMQILTRDDRLPQIGHKEPDHE